MRKLCSFVCLVFLLLNGYCIDINPIYIFDSDFIISHLLLYSSSSRNLSITKITNDSTSTNELIGFTDDAGTGFFSLENDDVIRFSGNESEVDIYINENDLENKVIIYYENKEKKLIGRIVKYINSVKYFDAKFRYESDELVEINCRSLEFPFKYKVEDGRIIINEFEVIQSEEVNENHYIKKYQFNGVEFTVEQIITESLIQRVYKKRDTNIEIIHLFWDSVNRRLNKIVYIKSDEIAIYSQK